MGQKLSHQTGGGFNKIKLPLPWMILRNHQTTHNPNPQQPIKFQYKTKRKHANKTNYNRVNNLQTLNNINKSSNQSSNHIKNTNVTDVKCKIVKTENVSNTSSTLPFRTKSEPSLVPERNRERYRHRKKSITKIRNNWQNDCDNEDYNIQQFGYEIQDVDAFLTNATIEKPANIPVVLAFPSVLYQTRTGGYQAEISLPLGMVVNAVFKNQHWLYVQTPHAEEGYVSYAACLPLGIIPPPDNDTPAPCWEISTDVFPKPSGNMTDTEKLSSKSDCGSGSRCRSGSRNYASTCGERSFDRLYLQAAASAKNRGIRQTLLVIVCDYEGNDKNGLPVKTGDVVILINAQVKGWFWVRNKEGTEGFIPSAVAGHGFL